MHKLFIRQMPHSSRTAPMLSLLTPAERRIPKTPRHRIAAARLSKLAGPAAKVHWIDASWRRVYREPGPRVKPPYRFLPGWADPEGLEPTVTPQGFTRIGTTGHLYIAPLLPDPAVIAQLAHEDWVQALTGRGGDEAAFYIREHLLPFGDPLF